MENNSQLETLIVFFLFINETKNSLKTRLLACFKKNIKKFKNQLQI